MRNQPPDSTLADSPRGKQIERHRTSGEAGPPTNGGGQDPLYYTPSLGLLDAETRVDGQGHITPSHIVVKHRANAPAELMTPPSGSSSMSLDAMHSEEVMRVRGFLKIIVLLIAASCTVMLPMGGDPTAKLLTQCGLGASALLFLWMIYRLRDESAYRPGPIAAAAYFSLLVTYPGMYYWGIASPLPAIYTLCIYFLGQSTSMAIAMAAYISCSAAQGLLAVLMITGVLADRSLVPISAMGTTELLISQALIHGMYLAAFLASRSSRTASMNALSRLEQAVRNVARREALLQEAKQELNRALRIGDPGRCTDQVLGQFRLGMLLGHGGMGEVYEATHLKGGQRAAVKLLHPHMMSQHQYVERFLREAEAAARLDTPHVVKVFASGGDGDNEIPYLAMEFLDGHDLGHHLRERKRIPIAEVIDMVHQVGLGLAAARQAGIIHRDIKPQNLFRTRQGGGVAQWKILDFGISKLMNTSGTLTAGNIVGTPAYMAPEQARGQGIDHRADLFSLASVVYRALTGQPAFTGGDPAYTLYQVVYVTPEQPSSLAPLHDDIDLVLALALAKQPEQRFDSGTVLAEALAQAAQGRLDNGLRERARKHIANAPWGRPVR